MDPWVQWPISQRALVPRRPWAHGPWKGVRQNLLRKNNPNPLNIELYNLDKDISESKDVAADHPKVVAEIRKLMTEQHTASQFFPIKPLDNQ